ncbi:MAG: ABC transporter permease, partial [Anaerolineae bacterium]
MRRDWAMTAFLFTLPVLQLFLLAHSTSGRIEGLDVALLDRDRSTATRRIVEALGNRDELQISHFPANVAEARDLLDGGDAVLAIVVPEGFAAAVDRPGDGPAIQLIADASNDLIADIALGAARQALIGFAQEATPLGSVPGSALGPSGID